MIAPMVALILVSAASPSHASPPSSCVEKWFAKAGPAPRKPIEPKHATAEQERAYRAEMKVYRPMASRYAAAAKAFGQKCILGNGPRKRPEATADAARLLEKYIDAKTGFVNAPPTDVTDFCRGYQEAAINDRVRFWRTFFLAIVVPESGFNNASLMLDGAQYSIGLYQVSLDNGCGVATEEDLLDPERNTACAVHIMGGLERPRLDAHGHPRNIIGGDGNVLKSGAASYWSTLRAQRDPHTNLLIGPRKGIMDAVGKLDICRGH